MQKSLSEWQEDQRLLEQVMRDQEREAAIAAFPVNIHTGRDHAPAEASQVQYQRCGGGRRIIRKKIGGA